MQEHEVVLKDEGFRRRILTVVAVIALVGAALIGWVQHLLQGIQRLATMDVTLAVERLEDLIKWIAAGHAVVSIWVVALCLRTAVRTWNQSRFPPQGMKVVKDTVIRRGTRARVMSLVLFVLAFGIVSTNAIWFVLRACLDSLLGRSVL